VPQALAPSRFPRPRNRESLCVSHQPLAAKTIANIYQECGQMEIFCRWSKQNLKIKTCIGNSENAVFTQI
jgi:IS4 transposase